MSRPVRSLFKQYIMPAEHGGWFLWIGPFLLGALAALQFRADLVLLLALIVNGYLLRQPLIILVKALTGRRARADAPLAFKVLAALGGIAALLFLLLLLRGSTFLVWLALPAGPVLALQLWLVSRRQERQMGIELVGSGVLALAAPAAYWVGRGATASEGWWLWALSWIYNASAILYVYLRLKQRRLNEVPRPEERLRQGAASLAYAVLSLGFSVALGWLGVIPPLAIAAYSFALLHYIYGTWRPAVHARPVKIGIEQSSATLLFYLLLALAFKV